MWGDFSFVIPGEGALAPQTRKPAAPQRSEGDVSADLARGRVALSRAAGFRVSTSLRPE
jgi:hypothetical protein